MLVALAFAVARDKSQEQDPLVAAVRRGGLREAARIKGHYVSTERTTGWMKYELESLTQNSSDVIIGTPMVGSCNLLGSGDGIVTAYSVRIDQTLKGKSNEKRLVTLEVPGGKVTFDDGTSAEIKTPDLGPIEEHQSYLMFLRPRGNASQVFGLTGGGQGLFELSASDSMVKPLGDKLIQFKSTKISGVSDFLEEIKIAAKRYPGTIPCCN